MEGKETVLLESFATKVAEQKSLGIITNTGKDHAEILSKYGGLLGDSKSDQNPEDFVFGFSETLLYTLPGSVA